MKKQPQLTLLDIAVKLKQLEDRLEELSKKTQEPVQTPKYVDMDKAAQILGIGRSSMYALMRGGKIAYILVGKQRRFLASDLEKYLQGQYVSPQSGIL